MNLLENGTRMTRIGRIDAGLLVPKLQLGNPVHEALGNCSMHCSTSSIHGVVASRTGREARASKTRLPSWSLGTSVTQ